MRSLVAALAAVLLFALPLRPAVALDAEDIENATLDEKRPGEAALVKAAVLLDRMRISPGVVDGKSGDNFGGAVAAFQRLNDLQPTGRLDGATWDRLVAQDRDPVLTDYEISTDDVAGPFAEKIPAKMEDQAELPRLAYRNVREELAERFHMSEELLSRLNRGVRLDEAGARIRVAAVRGQAKPGDNAVARIVIDKTARELRAFDDRDRLLAYYPASVGSEEKPAPSGVVHVTRIARNPSYTYNPDYAFKGVRTDEKFTIKPGPNNPVGLVWIALEGEGYGIHGTPEPEKVGKTASHGCVRLTNWDALDLAVMTKKGVPVEFVE